MAKFPIGLHSCWLVGSFFMANNNQEISNEMFA